MTYMAKRNAPKSTTPTDAEIAWAEQMFRNRDEHGVNIGEINAKKARRIINDALAAGIVFHGNVRVSK